MPAPLPRAVVGSPSPVYVPGPTVVTTGGSWGSGRVHVMSWSNVAALAVAILGIGLIAGMINPPAGAVVLVIGLPILGTVALVKALTELL